MRVIMRAVLGLAGLAALLLAGRFWIDPAKTGALMDLTAGGAAGLGTLRADMGGYFGAAGLLLLAAAARGERVWLTPVLLMLGMTLAGRVINLVLTDGGAALYPPMVVEAVLIGVTALGLRVLRPTAA